MEGASQKWPETNDFNVSGKGNRYFNEKELKQILYKDKKFYCQKQPLGEGLALSHTGHVAGAFRTYFRRQ